MEKTDEELWNEEAAAAAAGEVLAPDEALTNTPPADEQLPAEADEGKTPAEPPTNEADDIVARIGRQVMAELDTRLNPLADRLRRIEGGHGTLSDVVSKINERLSAAAAVSETVHAPTEAEIAEAAKDLKHWQNLLTEFPEWADAVNERLALEAKLRPAPAAAAPAVNFDEVRGEFKQELDANQKQIELRLVDITHRGWRELVKTPAFEAWKAAQPPDVLALAASDRAEDAIDMLDKFKAYQKTAEAQSQNRERRLEAAAGLPVGGGRGAPTTKSPDEMTPEEYWDYLAKSGKA